VPDIQGSLKTRPNEKTIEAGSATAGFKNTLAYHQKCNYNVGMKVQIIKIGNSQGIRIPKVLLQESQIGREVELIPEKDQIVIRPIKRIRSGWEKSFQAMAKNKDDMLLDESSLIHQNSWDEQEWEWDKSPGTEDGL